MRAAALVDAPLGDGPMTWSSGMHTERDAACEMKNWRVGASKTAWFSLNTHTAFEESAIQYATFYVPHSLCSLWLQVVIASAQKHLLICFLSPLKPELRVADRKIQWLNQAASLQHTAQCSWLDGLLCDFPEACGGVMQRNTFQVKTLSMARAQSDNKDRWQGGWWWKEGGGRDSDITGT